MHKIVYVYDWRVEVRLENKKIMGRGRGHGENILSV